MKVGFLVWNRFQVGHFAPLMAQFDNPDVIFTNRQPSALKGFDPQWLTRYGAYSRFVLETELNRLDGQYDIILTQYTPPLAKPWKHTKLVMTQYSMAKPKTAYNGRWLTADAGLVYGDYSAQILSKMCPVVSAGNPRFDPLFDGTLDPRGMKQLEQRLDPFKKTILFLPTWGDLSSANSFYKALNELGEDYNVIYKPHHITAAKSAANEMHHDALIDISGVTDLLDTGPYLMALADVVISDMSGAIFDALYCRRPVVLMGLDVDFATHAKAEPTALEIAYTDRIGPVVTDPAKLADTIGQTLSLSNPYQDANEALVAEAFTQRGDCAALAAEGLTRLVKDAPIHHDLQAYVAPVVRSLMLGKAHSNALKRAKSKTAFARHLRQGSPKVHAKSVLRDRVRRLPTPALNSLANLSQKLGQSRAERYFAARRDEAQDVQLNKQLVTKAQIDPADLHAFRTLPKTAVAKHTLLKRLRARKAFFDYGYAVECWAGGSAHASYGVIYPFYCAASNLRFSRAKFKSLRANLLAATQDRFFRTVVIRRRVLRDLGFVSEALAAGQSLSDTEQVKLEQAAALLADVLPYLDHAAENEMCGELQQHVITPQGEWVTLEKAEGPILELGLMLGFGRVVSAEGQDNRRAMIEITRQIIAVARDSGWHVLPRLQAGHSGAVPISGKYPSITWHTTDTGVPGQLHLKVGSFSEFIILDSHGYSGWSSLADRSLEDIVARVDPKEADQHYASLQKSLVSTGKTKYAQSDEVAPTADKYILLPMQVMTDTVAQLAHIDGLSLLQLMVDWVSGSEYTLVVKRHPKCKSKHVKEALETASQAGHIILSNAPIHTLVAGADAVVTVNSGVGAEALLHAKAVITTGRSDYAAATVEVRRSQDLIAALNNLANHPISPAQIKAFLWVYTKAYQIHPKDSDAVRAHIKAQLAQAQLAFTSPSIATSRESKAAS